MTLVTQRDIIKCPKDSKCERKAGHANECGGPIALLLDVVNKQGGRLLGWLERKIGGGK